MMKANMLQGVYIGADPNLSGKSALIRTIPFSIFVDAQFTDYDTGLSHGWREFYARDFEITPWSDAL